MERASSLHTVLSGLSIALVAAAIGDPLIERISNTGIFGSGYRDENQQSVITVLVAGLVLASVLVVARVRHTFRKDRGSVSAWLRGLAAGFAGTSGSRNIAIVFAAQLAIVYLMENCEQMIARGNPVHGCSWLGAPAAISLAIHFAVCLSCAFGARRITNALLAAAIVAIRGAIDCLLAARPRDAARGFATHSDIHGILHPELLLVRRIRGRAPPSRSALA